MTAVLHVAPSGTVSAVEVVYPDDGPASRCIAKVAKAIAFPERTAAATVTHAFVLE